MANTNTNPDLRVGDKIQIEGVVLEIGSDDRSKPVVVLADGLHYCIDKRNITRVIERAPKPALWYPPQLEGYTPWIEGPPPSALLMPFGFQVLDAAERASEAFVPSEIPLNSPQLFGRAVAHCTFRGGL